jgi:hypothetical protein
MAKQPTADEIADAMVANLEEGNDDPEAYWAKKQKAQAKGKGVVKAVEGPQGLDDLDVK